MTSSVLCADLRASNLARSGQSVWVVVFTGAERELARVDSGRELTYEFREGRDQIAARRIAFEMPTVDGEHREILFQVAVIGGVSERFAEQLGLRNSELQLGEVQNYRPRFAFASFPSDPWADGSKGQDLERLVPYLDALVLNDAFSEGTHYSSTALERLSRALSPGKLNVPCAIFGGPALAQEWQSLSGVAPVIAVEPAPDQALLCVRALTKALLRSKMKSQPPPPS